MRLKANRLTRIFVATAAVFATVFICASVNAKTETPSVVSAREPVFARVPDSEWYQCKNGTGLRQNMSVKTGRGGRAVISIGDDSSLTLLPNTEIFIKNDLNKKTSGGEPHVVIYGGAVVLKRGRTGDKHEFVVSTIPADVSVGRGVFTIISDQEKESALGVVEGKGCLFVKGKKYCAGEGQEISAKKNSTPSQAAFPAKQTYAMWKAEGLVSDKESGGGGALMLSVSQPQDGSYASRNPVVVSGKTLPGATVSVNGEKAEVRAGGDYSAKVKLAEGENKISVEARLDDKKKTVSLKVIMDTTPPLLTISQPSGYFDPSMFGNCSGRRCYIQIFGITEPGVTLRINRVDVSRYVEDDGSFFITDFPVDTSENSLIIEAEDSFRQRSRQILTISQPSDMDGDGAPDTSDACPADPMCR